MRYICYDTCSLLLAVDNLPFNEDKTKILISSITLEEIENIKTSANKDPDVKFAARKLTQLLNEYEDKYLMLMWHKSLINPDLPDNNDSKIIMCVHSFELSMTSFVEESTLEFVTNDLCCKNIARSILKCPIYSYEEEKYEYDGYKEIIMSDNEMAYFYSNLDQNIYNLYTNEYLLIYEETSKECVDKLCWDGNTHRKITFSSFNSQMFGNIKPLKNDSYQQLLFDCLEHNSLTIIRGIPGSGKSMIALAYLFKLLERGKIDNIVIFCNPVVVKDAVKLGFYPGDKNVKLLDSQIGNFLSTKLGGIEKVNQMIENNQLTLVPMSDCRGMSIKSNSGIYMTEAQNTNKDLMKLLIQRIEEGCITIIEGDDRTQVDMNSYIGNNNGLTRLSEVFRGENYYGEIRLKKCHRSRMAERAELM